MRIPPSLASLAEFGAIEDVVRPLMSGKEAHVFLVIAGGKECIAKVYKDAQVRAFRNRAEYTEGRKTRNSRDQRAMGKRTHHGRNQDEAAWQSAEVDMIHRLRAAGVRVPRPYRFMDGVLIMELIADAEGDPAPRLGDLQLDAAAAALVYDAVIREVIRMLCAGIIHGDLSDFNVLMGAEGPVIIDFPQAIDAARNPNARKILIRDVDNLHRFLRRFAPTAPISRLAEEMWELYETNALTPDTQLSGTWRASDKQADTASVLDHISDAEWDERQRLQMRGPAAGGHPSRRGQGSGRGGPPRGARGSDAPGSRPAEGRGSRPGSARAPHRPEPPRPKAGAPGTRASVAAMISAAEEAAARPRSEQKPEPPASRPGDGAPRKGRRRRRGGPR